MFFENFHLLLRCGREYGHQKLRDGGFGDTAHMLCAYIYSHEGCSQDEVAQALRLDKTTVAKALQGLESSGRINRVQDRCDKRRHVLSVTGEGRADIARMIAIRDDWMNRVQSVLSEEERRQFDGYCERLLRAAEDLLKERK